MTKKAIYNKKLKSQLNRRDKNRGKELTLIF